MELLILKQLFSPGLNAQPYSVHGSLPRHAFGPSFDLLVLNHGHCSTQLTNPYINLIPDNARASPVR